MKTLALLTLLSLTASTYQCASQHTVQSGDICFNIAQSNGISVDLLIGLNSGLNCDALQIGQVLCLNGGVASTPPTGPSQGNPTAPTSTPASSGGSGGCAIFETVEAGMICFNLAENNGLSLDQLLGLNPGLNCDVLQVGQQVCVGGSPQGPQAGVSPANPNATQGCSKQYAVVAGDICFNIAQNNGLSVEQLQANNPGLNCNALQVGQAICLEGSAISNNTQPTIIPKGCSRQYIVVSDDICFNIAQQNGIALEQLQKSNPGLNCNALQVGQQLCLDG